MPIKCHCGDRWDVQPMVGKAQIQQWHEIRFLVGVSNESAG
jgi:hypothetical protein